MLRFTGGSWRGRAIPTPKHGKFRPSSAKLRQALYNVVQEEVIDANVLDLFCGPGTLGLEGLSRGAKHCVFVDSDKGSCRFLEGTLKELEARDLAEVICEKIEKKTISKLSTKLLRFAPYDLVLLDPPYEAGHEQDVIRSMNWEGLLSSRALVFVEWSPLKSGHDDLPDEVGSLQKIREKSYGDSRLTTYRVKVEHDR